MILSTIMHRFQNSALLFVFTAALIWRFLDFMQEVVLGTIKMSFGPLHLVGPVAVFVQLSLIAIIFLLVTKAALACIRLEAKTPPS